MKYKVEISTGNYRHLVQQNFFCSFFQLYTIDHYNCTHTAEQSLTVAHQPGDGGFNTWEGVERLPTCENKVCPRAERYQEELLPSRSSLTFMTKHRSMCLSVRLLTVSNMDQYGFISICFYKQLNHALVLTKKKIQIWAIMLTCWKSTGIHKLNHPHMDNGWRQIIRWDIKG